MGHSLVSGFVGLVVSLVSPLVNTAAVASAAPDCNLTVSQSSVSSGTAAQITWWTANASAATMSQDGSAPVSVALSGSAPVTITRNTTLSLTARNSYGAYKTCTANISVSAINSGTPTCGISAAPGIHYAGQPVQLVWYSQNATAGQISYLGQVSGSQLAQGTATVYPSASTLYTMSVANSSASRTCSALVTITPRTTTSYQPVTTQQVSYRPVTTSAPSSAARSYPAYTYPSSANSYRPSYTSGSGLGYGSYGSSGSMPSSYNYPGMEGWDSPSHSNGLGDWTLTSAWNNLGTGEGIFTSHDCYYGECNANPYEWGYSLQQADGSYANQYGVGDGLGYGASVTWDDSGNISRYGSTPGIAEIDAIENDPSWHDSEPLFGSDSTQYSLDQSAGANDISGNYQLEYGNGLNNLWDNWDSGISGGGIENWTPDVGPSLDYGDIQQRGNNGNYIETDWNGNSIDTF